MPYLSKGTLVMSKPVSRPTWEVADMHALPADLHLDEEAIQDLPLGHASAIVGDLEYFFEKDSLVWTEAGH